MKVFFYYVRHGQTLFNVRRRIQGSCDSPLTKQGIVEARIAGSALRDVKIDRAYCSSSERAVDTAALVLEGRNIQAIPMKGLKEFDFGLLDGERVDDIQNQLAAHSDMDFTDLGGDSLETISERIIRTFSEITSQCKDGDHVLIVSHGAYGMHLMRTLLHVRSEVFESGRLTIFPNGGIMQFVFEDGEYRMLAGPCEPTEFQDVAK